ncbi:hypothetical protein FNT36_05705 [Hymenobacter setariae]|uniref:Uncharacterized protein n=1 Tax=Hymenobacter setariae TaxID=2594794 RepID=A0A558C460_9BACT|nr:hypothetical protein [Hymenobacter setariae]TVT43579.1 hypothetical protein FNT36_05705 [Hymenobacter setariae]
MKRLLLLVPLFLSSCGLGDSPEDHLDSLYRQRISNSKYVIYDFNYAGDFATSLDYGGLTFLDSSAVFSRDKIDKLPSSYFVGKPVAERFHLLLLNYGQGRESPKDTSLTPVREYTKKYNGVEVAVTEYKHTYGSATLDTGLKQYRFERFQETPDSLIFYSVTNRYGGAPAPAMAFVKGNIQAVEFAGDTVAYLEINRAFIGRGSVYQSPKPFQLVSNQPIVGMTTFRFYPRKTVRAVSLSDIGIYKKVKLQPVKEPLRD